MATSRPERGSAKPRIGMQALIDRLERLIHRDVGRGMEEVFRATRGGLWNATSALAASAAPRIGLVTGFFVPAGDPPAAETDGPAGAALMAHGFTKAGLTCRVATDTICQSACRVALDAADEPGVPIDVVAPGESTEGMIALWRQRGIDWVVAIERCGPASDGRPRNMRGSDIAAYAAQLERLFTAGPWRTIAVGDGGNEIGMGAVPRSILAQQIPFGEAIGCVIEADFLITTGVSHWGAYAIMAALALLRPDWSAPMRQAMDPELDQFIIETMVRHGPAVDGVSLRQEPTIDGLAMQVHRAVLHRMLRVVGQAGG